MSKILLLSFQQAVRSITLILLPIAFLSLIVWATAGSSSGNTADPMRAALWIFLLLHNVPLEVSLSNTELTGAITFLPLGALALAFIAIRSGVLRVKQSLTRDVFSSAEAWKILLSYSIWYSLIGLSLVFFVNSSTVKSSPLLAWCAFFLISLASALYTLKPWQSDGVTPDWSRPAQLALVVTVFLIGYGGLIFASSLLVHFSTVLNLTEVIAPGVFGGIAFLLIQVAYLPNFAIATLGYISGAGSSIGMGTELSPFIHRISEIPAIPLLGGLPTSQTSPAILLSLIFLFVGLFAARFSSKIFHSEKENFKFLLYFHLILTIFIFILILLSSGELLSDNLSYVGAHPYFTPLIITVLSSIGSLFYISLPKIFAKESIDE